jgi:Meckel syndrome type 1 protein
MAAAAPPAAQPAPAAELRAYAPKQAEPVAQGYAANQQAADRSAQAASGVMATPPAPASPPPDDDTARNAKDTPAQELDKIRRLLARQHRDEARQRLADFHRDHPDYPLPDDLRTQLLTP